MLTYLFTSNFSITLCSDWLQMYKDIEEVRKQRATIYTSSAQVPNAVLIYEVRRATLNL